MEAGAMFSFPSNVVPAPHDTVFCSVAPLSFTLHLACAAVGTTHSRPSVGEKEGEATGRVIGVDGERGEMAV